MGSDRKENQVKLLNKKMELWNEKRREIKKER